MPQEAKTSFNLILRAFCPVRRLHVLTLRYDWLISIFTSAVIGQLAHYSLAVTRD